MHGLKFRPAGAQPQVLRGRSGACTAQLLGRAGLRMQRAGAFPLL